MGQADGAEPASRSHIPPMPHASRLPGTALAVALASGGAVLGCTLAYTAEGRGRPLWYMWAPTAVALCAASGFVFGYGLRRWRDLRALQLVRIRQAATSMVSLGLLGTLGVNVTGLIQGGDTTGWRNALMLTLPIWAGLPAAVTMYGIRLAALHTVSSLEEGAQFELLLKLRRLLQRLLAAIGSLVALVTLQTSAWLALQRDLTPSGSQRPPEYVLIVGAFGTLLIALAYEPAWTALQQGASRLAEKWFPLATLSKPEEVLTTADHRHKAIELLGAQGSLMTDLQAGAIILGPLLVGAASVWFPR